MSAWLQIRNWDKWQTYRKDRQQPPWIKLHRDLMRNAQWIALSDAQRGHMVAIWMLAADRGGRIPDDAKLIQKMCFLDKPPDLDLLIVHGFLDARVTPTRRQHDAPEERRVEIEVEPPKPAERAKGFPEKWVPENLSSLEAIEFDKFRDHFRANGKAMKDWEAAWRNWKRRAPEFSPRGSPNLKALNGGKATSQPTFRAEPVKIDNETWRKQRENT